LIDLFSVSFARVKREAVSLSLSLSLSAKIVPQPAKKRAETQLFAGKTESLFMTYFIIELFLRQQKYIPCLIYATIFRDFFCMSRIFN
jgi:hypothetical protein